MRVNLKVPYEQRHEAKALGARWDIARKTWYTVNAERLEPFLAWMPNAEFLRAGSNKRIDSKPGVATPRTDFSLPDCGCTHVAPWSDCAHTFAPSIR